MVDVMLAQPLALSTNFPCNSCPSLTRHPNYSNGNLLGFCSMGESSQLAGMRHSRIRKQLLLSVTDEGYFSQFNNFSPIDRRSKRRTISSFRMSKSEDGQIRMTKNPKKNQTTTGRRRSPPEISFFDKLVDKVLLLDGSSSDLQSSFPAAIILLAIVTASILTTVVSKVLYIGLFLFFSSPALFPSLLPWNIDRDDSSAEFPLDEEAEETSKFTLYYLSIVYIGSWFLTTLIEPFESESAGALQTYDSFLLPTAVIAIAILSRVLSGSGLMLSVFSNEDRDTAIDEMDDDYIDLFLSAEKGLMDMWDQEFERKHSSDNNDD